MGWGLMALPWMVVALCIGVGACSRAPQAQEQDVANAPKSTPARPTSATGSTPNIPSEALPEPISEKALAFEASEQDQDEADVEDKAKSVPDDSYVHAPLRASYIACVKESRGVTPDLKECADEEYAYHHERFRAAVEKIVNSPDSVEKDQVMDELAAWWSNTNTYCVWDPEHDGQGQMLDAQSCLLNRVANHAPEVEKIAQKF